MPRASATSLTLVLPKPRATTSRQVALRISSRRTLALTRATSGSLVQQAEALPRRRSLARPAAASAAVPWPAHGSPRPSPVILTEQSVESPATARIDGGQDAADRRPAAGPRRARRGAPRIRAEPHAAPGRLHLRARARLRDGAAVRGLVGVRGEGGGPEGSRRPAGRPGHARRARLRGPGTRAGQPAA